MAPPGAVLAELVKRFRPTAAEGLKAVYQLHLTGDGGDSWHLTIADQRCQLEPGRAHEPDVTITLSVDDWKELIAGRLDPVGAYLSGRLQLSGDLTLATRLKSLFGL